MLLSCERRRRLLTPWLPLAHVSQAYLDHLGYGAMAWGVIAAVAQLGPPGGAKPVTRAHAAHAALAPLFARCPYAMVDGALVAMMPPRPMALCSSTPFVLAVRSLCS